MHISTRKMLFHDNKIEWKQIVSGKKTKKTSNNFGGYRSCHAHGRRSLSLRLGAIEDLRLIGPHDDDAAVGVG